MKIRSILGMSVMALLLAGCGNDSGDTVAVEGTMTSGLPVVEGRGPETAVGVIEARKTLRPGDRVVVRGVVGGRIASFVDGFASMVIADAEHLYSCAAAEDDHCPTPWDYCCEEPDKLAAGIASVEVVDGTGEVVAESLKGVRGLKELDTVVVEGIVSQSGEDAGWVIQAETIYLAQRH